MTINDLNDTQFEDLADRCFIDTVLMDEFIYQNMYEFEDYLHRYEVTKDHENYLQYKLEFCEKYDDEYIQFGFNKFYGGK